MSQFLQINIISEQTIPNILFIKQFEEMTNRFVFVSTNRMNQNGQLQNIIDVCQIPKEKYQVVTVNEESLMDVETQLEALHFNLDDTYLVNITGGTKVMSLGVYSVFSRFNSQMYYIPIGKNECKQIFPPDNEKRIALDYRVSLVEYLQGYGIEITNPFEVNLLTQPPSVTSAFLKSNYSLSPVIRALREVVGTNQLDQFSLQRLPRHLAPLSPFLTQIGFVKETPRMLNKIELNYLLGQWLEEYVYFTIQTLFNLDNRFIGKSVMIQRQQVRNELDVVFIYNNTIYVIECKTGMLKYMFDHTTYKLNALKREFGLFVKSAIVFLNSYTDQTNRVELFNIKLISGQNVKTRTFFENELTNFIQ